MHSTGIMEEIRNLLNQGTSSAEAIALGYKPSTVYKAQRQLRRAVPPSDPQAPPEVVVTNLVAEDWTRSHQENQGLRSSLESASAERDSLQWTLDLALDQIDGLVEEANQAHMLQDRLDILEPRVAQLERDKSALKSQLSDSHVVMQEEVSKWQVDLEKEKLDHRNAEVRLELQDAELEGLRSENQRLTQLLQEMPGILSQKLGDAMIPIKLELAQLRQLKVWTGHPCSVCGKPTSGIPSRDAAARILKDLGYGHFQCVKRKAKL